MTRLIIDAILFVAAAVFLVVYGKGIIANMQATADATAKDAQLKATSGISWLWLKIEGWKTIVLGWITALAGMVAAIPSDVVQTWTGLPWASVVDQKTAAFIAIGSGLLMPLFHAQSLAKAAQTPPQQD